MVWLTSLVPADLNNRRRSGCCRDRADVAHDTSRPTHWSIRSMAAATGFSHTTIRRMWVAFGLRPQLAFKLSNDPLFVDKVRDIAGFYLSPANRAVVLSIDKRARSRHSIASSRSCR